MGRIGLRICACFVGLAVLVAVVAYRTRRTHDGLRARVGELGGGAVQEVIGATDMLLALETTQLAARQLVTRTSEARPRRAASLPADRGRGSVVAAIDSGMDALDEQLAATRRATEAAGGHAARRRRALTSLEHIGAEVDVHRALLRRMVGLAASEPAAAARLLVERLEPHHLDVLIPLILAQQDRAERDLRRTAAALGERLVRVDRSNALLALLALAAAGLMGVFVVRSLARSVEGLQRATAQLGDGDLGARVSEGAAGELAALAGGFNEMAERLQASTVSRVSVERVIGAIDQIAFVSDADGRVQMINQAAVERLGWEPGELSGRHLQDVMHHDASGDVALLAKDGTTRPAVCVPRTLHDPAGRPQGRVWIARETARA